MTEKTAAERARIAARWAGLEAAEADLSTPARRAERAKIERCLLEAQRYGEAAHRVAASLLSSDLDYGQILAAARRAPADRPSESSHRLPPGNVLGGSAAAVTRAPTQEAEADWLRAAREEAERAWGARFPQMPIRDSRTPMQHGHSFHRADSFQPSRLFLELKGSIPAGLVLCLQHSLR